MYLGLLNQCDSSYCKVTWEAYSSNNFNLINCISWMITKSSSRKLQQGIINHPWPKEGRERNLNVCRFSSFVKNTPPPLNEHPE